MMPLATTIPHRATRFGARRRPHVARSSTRALENRRRTSGVTFGSGGMRKAKKGRGRAVLARASAGRDREYYDWIDANGISAPCVGIGYVGGGIPDDNETYRGAVVVRPVARGDVLVRCPTEMAFALPPEPPNMIPDYVPDAIWKNPPGVPEGRRAQEFRMALVLLRERAKFESSPWYPYLRQLPDDYDLLGEWTPPQLAELRSPSLVAAAESQREENAAAHAAASLAKTPCGSLTPAAMTWGLNTVRSRMFMGPYPTEGPAPYPARASVVVPSPTSSSTRRPEGILVLPLLDGFNHAPEREGATRLAHRDGAFELRANRDFEPGDEATICYGKLANDELLLRFGFCVDDSVDECVPLPGCAEEIEALLPDSARACDLQKIGLDAAVRNARLDKDGMASPNLLWALRAALASEEEYENAGGAMGFRVNRGGPARLAAEAALAAACEEEMRALGGDASMEEDITQLEAASKVLSEFEAECAPCDEDDEECVEPDPERCGAEGEEGNSPSFLRRLVLALSFRVGRKRILQAALRRYGGQRA